MDKNLLEKLNCQNQCAQKAFTKKISEMAENIFSCDTYSSHRSDNETFLENLVWYMLELIINVNGIY